MNLKNAISLIASVAAASSVAAQSDLAASGVPLSTPSICPNVRQVFSAVSFPREAVKERLRIGEAVVAFTVLPDNQIVDIVVVKSSHRIFAKSAIAVVKQLSCNSEGKELRLSMPFTYRFEGPFTSRSL